MGTPQTAGHCENLKRKEADDQLRFDRMPFLFPRIMRALSVGRTFNGLLSHIKEDCRESGREQHMRTRQTKERDKIPAIAVVELIGIGFTDPELSPSC